MLTSALLRHVFVPIEPYIPTWVTPNGVVYTRFASAAFLWPLWYVHPMLAGGLFIFAAITDWIDGNLARTRNLCSAYGAAIDAHADKALMVSAWALLWWADGLTAEAAAGIIVNVARDGAVEVVRWLGYSTGSTLRSAKWKTAFQMLGTAALLCGSLDEGLVLGGGLLLWIAALFGGVSGYVYLRKAFLNH